MDRSPRGLEGPDSGVTVEPVGGEVGEAPGEHGVQVGGVQVVEVVLAGTAVRRAQQPLGGLPDRHPVLSGHAVGEAGEAPLGGGDVFLTGTPEFRSGANGSRRSG